MGALSLQEETAKPQREGMRMACPVVLESVGKLFWEERLVDIYRCPSLSVKVVFSSGSKGG
jgi:hypothetical protein